MVQCARECARARVLHLSRRRWLCASASYDFFFFCLSYYCWLLWGLWMFVYVCVWERHETRCGMVVVEVGIYIKHTEFGQILSVSRPQRMVQHWNILPEKEDNIFGGRWRIFACFLFCIVNKVKKKQISFLWNWWKWITVDKELPSTWRCQDLFCSCRKANLD